MRHRPVATSWAIMLAACASLFALAGADAPTPPADGGIHPYSVPPRDITRGSGATASTAAEPARVMLSAAYSPDGKLLALAGDPGTIELRKVGDNTLVATLTAHTEPVTTLAFSPDGATLASAGMDRSIRLWDVAKGEEKTSFVGHDGWVWQIAFSPDGATLASASHDATVRLWDVATGRTRKLLSGHVGPVRSLAFAPNGSRLATAGTDTTVRIWDVARGVELDRWTGHLGPVRAIVWSPDGQSVASAGEDHRILVRDASDGRPRVRVSATAEQVIALAFAQNGKVLLAGGYDQTIRVIDTGNGKVRDNYRFHADGITSLAVNPTSGSFVSTGYDRQIKEFVTARTLARLAATVAPPSRGSWVVLFAPGGTTSIVYERSSPASKDRSKSLRVLDPQNPSTVREILDAGEIQNARFSGNGQRLLTMSREADVSIWELSTGRKLGVIAAAGGNRNASRILALNTEGTLAALGGSGERVRIWDIDQGRERTTLAAPENVQAFNLRSILFSPDGERLAVEHQVFRDGSNSNELSIWDMKTNSLLSRCTRDVASFLNDWTPDGKNLLQTGVTESRPDGTPALRKLEFLDPATGKPARTMGIEGSSGLGPVFSPDGRILALAGEGGNILFWDLATARSLGSLKAADQGVAAFRFHSDGSHLLSADTQGEIKVWKLDASLMKPR